jgi:hypothetical protein
MRAQEGSTRTVGYILLQLLYDLIGPDQVFDRLLKGPTDDVWLNPWVDYLQRRGVVFHTAVQVNGFELDGGRVCPVQATENGNPFQIAASYYIAAMPVDVMSTLLTPALKAAAPSLANLDRLQTRWMNGIQFYLRRDVPLVRGHAIYLDSPWALTSVSQRQFWTGVDLSSFGDGTVGGILSVDISEWEQPGVLYDKPAMQCTATEIKEEVWTQLKQHLNVAGGIQLDDVDLETWFLDPDIQFPNPTLVTNLEPLLVNTAGSLSTVPKPRSKSPTCSWLRTTSALTPISRPWRVLTKPPAGPSIASCSQPGPPHNPRNSGPSPNPNSSSLFKKSTASGLPWGSPITWRE